MAIALHEATMDFLRLRHLSRLAQEFCLSAPDVAWVTDITYVRTREGWLFLAVVIDLFSRRGKRLLR